MRRDRLFLVALVALTVALPLTALGIHHATLGLTSPTGVRDGLATLRLTGPEGNTHVNLPLLDAWRESWPDEVVGWFGAPFQLSGDTSSRFQVNGAYVTDGFFEVTELALARGRVWTPADPPSIVLGETIAGRLFGSADGALGRLVVVGDRHLSVTGVVRRGVRFPINQQAWLPMSLLEEQIPAQFLPRMPIQVIAAPPTGEGRADFRQRLETSLDERPNLRSDDRLTVGLVPVFEAYIGDALGPLRLFLILSWCLSVLGLLTVAHARALEESLRRQEFSIREALGASLASRVRDVVVRGLSRGLLGGLLGAGLAVVLVRLYVASGGLFGAYWVGGALGPELLLPAAGLILGVTLVSALVGTWHARGMGVRGLRETASTRSRSRTWAHRGLLFLEVAPAAGLIVLALATSTTSWQAARYWYGDDPERLLAVDVAVASDGTPTPTDTLLDLQRRLEGLPEVEAAGFVSVLPTQRSQDLDLELRRPGEAPRPLTARVALATPEYLRVLGGPASSLALPTGPHLLMSENLRVQIEGAVASAAQLRILGAEESSPWYEITGSLPDLFLDWDFMESAPLPQGAPGLLLIRPELPPRGYLVARVRPGTGEGVEGVERTILDELARLGPRLTVGEPATYAERFGDAMRNFKVVNAVLWQLTLLILLLSILGVYAVSLRQVSSRQRELAIRASLGAPARRLLLAVFGAVSLVSLGGAVIGGWLGWRASEILGGTFLGGRLQAPLSTVVLGVSVALAAALGGGLVPALRILRISPGRALRQE